MCHQVVSDLFDQAESRAVLMGCSRYPQDRDLTPLPAVRANLVALESILTDPALCGMAREHCEVITDPASPHEVGIALHEAGSAAKDLFLVYYAGHGLVGRSGELYLAIPSTATTTMSYTAIPFSQVRDSIRQSAAKNRVLILDCCFSGRAIEAQSDPLSLARGQLEIEGAYTLTATPRNATALSPAGARLTAFTGELVKVLSEGIQGGEPVLTLDAVYADLHTRLSRKGHPLPEVSSTRTSGRLGIAHNTYGLRSRGEGIVDLFPGGSARDPEEVMSFSEAIDDTSALLKSFEDARPASPEPQGSPGLSISSLARDVHAATSVLRRTMGPGGRSTLVRKVNGTFLETSDSAAIIEVYREYSSSRPGIGFIVDVAEEMNRSCDDGLTTAAVLGSELVLGLANEIADGRSPIDLARSLQYLYDHSITALSRMVSPVQGHVQLSAAIRAQGIEPELGQALAAVLAVQEEWLELFVIPGEGRGVETAMVPALQVDAGIVSTYFTTDRQHRFAELEAPHVLVLDSEPSLANLLPILEKVISTGRPLAIFGPDFYGEVLSTLVVNAIRGTLRSIAIGVGNASQPKTTLNHIAAATGATVLGSPDSVAGAGLIELGEVRRLVATVDRVTMILGRDGPATGSTSEAASLGPDVDVHRMSAHIRAGQAAVLRIGAPGDAAQPSRTMGPKTAGRVSRRLLSGVVPGGGGAYLRLADSLELNQAGAALLPLVTQALRAPARQIATNAGQAETRPEEATRHAGALEAYDVLSDSVVDMWSHPLVDSALTVRRAWDLAFDLAMRSMQYG